MASKKILFFTEYEVSPMFGGIEKVTDLLTEGLVRNGFQVFSAFVIKLESNLPKTKFSEKLCVNPQNEDEFIKFIESNEIDTVVVQSAFQRFDFICRGVRKSKSNVRLIFAHHMSPTNEFRNLRFRVYKKTLFNKKSSYIKDSLRLLKWSLLYQKNIAQWKRRYRSVYENSEQVVLLSKEYINEWQDFTGIRDYSKFKIIHNAISFSNEISSHSHILDKEHRVLIVCRIDNGSKRIDKALKIWQFIEPAHPDWALDIVGDGPDREKIESMAKDLGLRNVTFYGVQNPIPYYLRSSIFMMTSDHEAWPLTLMEAQQLECVPIAFNTFGALTSVIDSGKSGLIVPSGDMNKYVEQLNCLMENDAEREKMAEYGKEYCRQFQQDVILNQWIKLLK